MSVKWREVGAILTGCLLMILASASTVWIRVGIKMLDRVTFLDVYYVNILNVLLPAGVVAGTLIFSIAAELVGRKIALLAVSVPYAAAFIIFQFAKSIPVACLGRVISGLAVGGSYAVLPIYIAEVAEPSSRGVLASLMTVFSLVGLLIYYSMAAYASYMVYNIVTVVISVIFFIVFLCIGVESPDYYIRKHKNQHETSKSEEAKLDEGNNGSDLLEIERPKIMSCLRSSSFIKSMIMMSLLIVIHHFSGVGMIPMFLNYVAAYLGTKDLDLQYMTILLTSVGLELCGSLLCTVLVDKLGRKPCLIISTICIAIFYIPIAIFAAIRETHLEVDPIPALTILFVVMFLIFFNIGIAPVPQILLGELFSPRLRMVGAAYIVSFQQVTFFLVRNYFQEISYFIGYTAILFIFLVSMLIAPVLVYFSILETKGKSLREIQIILENE